MECTWTKEEIDYLIKFHEKHNPKKMKFIPNCPCDHITESEIDSCEDCPYIEGGE